MEREEEWEVANSHGSFCTHAKRKKKKTAGGRAGECSILMAHHHLIFVIRASTSKSKDYNELPDFNYERGDGSYRLKTRQKISTGLKPRR